jgi:hypothetical protein
MMRRVGFSISIAAALLAVQGAAFAGAYENEVRGRWRGAWVVIKTEVYSSCSSGYSENRVSGNLVHSRSSRRFAAGEMARIEGVQVRKKSIELEMALTGMHLLPYQDGPFTLYTQRQCRLELQVNVPKSTVKARDVETVDAMLQDVVERYPTEDAARTSELWNGREDDEYPADYDLTLARHAAWQAEQINLAVDGKTELAVDEAGAVTARIRSDPPYLEGFAAGAMKMRQWRTTDCDDLLAMPFPRVRHDVPEEFAGEGFESWREGYGDGQLIVYSVLMIERLPACYVDVPVVSGDTGRDVATVEPPD